jgi:thioesterase DpgC
MPRAAKASSYAAADTTPLTVAGLSAAASAAWLRSVPALRCDFRRDSAACSTFWRGGARLRAQLPAKSRRNIEEERAADFIHRRERELRERYLTAHSEELYGKLTNGRKNFIRADRLVAAAGRLVPGLTPDAEELALDEPRALKDKEGFEIDQGLLLAHLLANESCGRHLCHAMLLPRPETGELLPKLKKDGFVDLGTASVTRVGQASIVEMRNPRFLNAMDYDWLAPLETAVDLAILDPKTSIAVLRGGVVDNPKYAGRRIFSSGINLTNLYLGRIPFQFYVDHVMGFEHKIFRGIASPDRAPDDTAGATMEKPWIAAVDAFAIGGGCQHLLVMDYVLAASDAYMTLPARKEGIIPGCANLRLPRFLGDRIARQAIMYGRRLDCDSAEGRLICDEVAPPERMDQALATVIDGLTSSGVVSAVANRRGFRIGQEPLDLFRRYLALYFREQAYCHFSPALIANLERYWNAAERKV